VVNDDNNIVMVVW